MVNPGTVSETGTLGSNLENKGSHSKNVGYKIANLGFLQAYSSTSQSSLGQGQPWAPQRGSQEGSGGSTVSTHSVCYLI